MRQRGEADFAPSSVGRATGRETRLTSRESPPSERRLRRICDAESSRVRVAVRMEVAPGPARPREAAVRRGGAAAPDHARARCASRTPALQPAEGGDARRVGRHGRVQRPATLVHGGLRAPRERRGWLLASSRPGPGSRIDVDIGRFGQLPLAAGKSARRQLPRSRAGGDGGADLAPRGVGRARARLALGGAAGRLGAWAAALKQPKIAAAGIGDLQSASLRPVRAAARLSRGSPACPGAVLTRGAERGAAAVEPGPWRLRDEPNRAPRRWRSKKSPAAARSCAASPQRFCVARPRLS